jgi:phage tail tape-measure protein
MTKSLIFLFLFIGSILGSYFPLIWGSELLSMASVFWSAVGGFVGIYIGYTLGKRWD